LIRTALDGGCSSDGSRVVDVGSGRRDAGHQVGGCGAAQSPSRPDAGIDLTGFHHFLDVRNDRLFTVPAGQATAKDTLVQLRGKTSLMLTVPPEQIVFLEA
jgi:hypothetical protein